MTTENCPPIRGVISILTNCRGLGAGANCAGCGVKGHCILRLAPPAPENSGGGAQDGGLSKIYTRSFYPQAPAGERSTGYYNGDMYVETRARGTIVRTAGGATSASASRHETCSCSRTSRGCGWHRENSSRRSMAEADRMCLARCWRCGSTNMWSVCSGKSRSACSTKDRFR